MGTTSLTRRYRFSAAHRLHCEDLSGEENRRIFGKCNNPNGHGHNYVLDVTVRGSSSASAEPAGEIEALDRLVQERVVSRFDHRDINRDPAFADRTTTGENLVLLVWDLLSAGLPAGRLEKIGLIETRDNYFEYDGAALSTRV